MDNSLPDRKRELLSLIVEEYIENYRPVGSKSISEYFTFSPATIRNEMNELEKMGFLRQIHHSSGRVPTKDAYKFYINTLMKTCRLSQEKKAEIQRKYDIQVERFDNLIQAASYLLSVLLEHLGIGVLFAIKDVVIDEIKFVYINKHKLLIILLVEEEESRDRVCEFREKVDYFRALGLVDFLNRNISGLTIREGLLFVERMKEEVQDEFERLFLDTLSIMLRRTNNVLFLEGISHFISRPEFRGLEDKMGSLFRFLDNREMLVEIFRRGFSSDSFQILLGGDYLGCETDNLSIVANSFDVSSKKRGVIGIIGPIRMKYRAVIPVVRFIAELIRKNLDEVS